MNLVGGSFGVVEIFDLDEHRVAHGYSLRWCLSMWCHLIHPPTGVV
jgi:hypothetical protein